MLALGAAKGADAKLPRVRCFEPACAIRAACYCLPGGGECQEVKGGMGDLAVLHLESEKRKPLPELRYASPGMNDIVNIFFLATDCS